MQKVKGFLLKKVTIELPMFLHIGLLSLVVCGIYYTIVK